MKLSLQGTAWMSERLQSAFEMHGTVPRDELEKLDWPELPQGHW